MKHCIKNITNTSQEQTFANTFAIILIPVRIVCVLHGELCVVFGKKCFMKLNTESKAENQCMDLQIWCVVLVFECQVCQAQFKKSLPLSSFVNQSIYICK